MARQLAVTMMVLISALIMLSIGFTSSDSLQQSQEYESHWRLIERIQKIWHTRWHEISKQLRKDPVDFSHRQLSAEETDLINKCLEFIKDPKKDLVERDTLLIELRKYPHISMLDDLIEIAKQQPSDKEPWRTLMVSFMENAVIAIGRIADERAIEALIKLIDSPVVEVRLRSLEQLQKLLGKQLPQGYRWGDYPLSPRHPICTEKGRRQGLETLQLWWRQNKDKIKIYWQVVWWHICS